MKLSRSARIGTSAALGSLLCALPALGQATINELHASMPGPDNDEFFELVGAPNASLTGLTYIVIGDGAGGSGVIENVTDLTGQVIDANGFFVAAESTFTIGTANFTTSLNFENSDQVTHMLVSGFTGTNGDDLDTNDDGILDITPWTAIVDCIALIGPFGGDQVYCTAQAGPDGNFVAAHAYICPTGAWTVGDFDLGDDTPGATNGPCRGFSVFRNGGGTNPASFKESNQSAIGGTWDTTIDIATPGALASIVAVSSGGPTMGSILSGVVSGELLCLPSYSLDIAAGTHSIAIPNDNNLVGTTVCCQGATFLPGATQLTNALDLTL